MAQHDNRFAVAGSRTQGAVDQGLRSYMLMVYNYMAGGVALNCVANGCILREGPFKDIWIQPAAGDAGGALGAGLAIWYSHLANDRAVGGRREAVGRRR